MLTTAPLLLPLRWKSSATPRMSACSWPLCPCMLTTRGAPMRLPKVHNCSASKKHTGHSVFIVCPGVRASSACSDARSFVRCSLLTGAICSERSIAPIAHSASSGPLFKGPRSSCGQDDNSEPSKVVKKVRRAALS